MNSSKILNKVDDYTRSATYRIGCAVNILGKTSGLNQEYCCNALIESKRELEKVNSELINLCEKI